MDKMIETAVIPAAGFGKRMGLLTTFFPKEMFPLGRLPMIQHTITELKRSGIKGICVVIRKGKEVIEEYLKRQRYKGIEINFDLGFGRTVFLSEALDYMTEKYLNNQTGEVDFLRTYEAIQERFPSYGIILKGVPCDLGTWEGYSYYLPKILRFMRQQEGL